jgi:hypothetical protein
MTLFRVKFMDAEARQYVVDSQIFERRADANAAVLAYERHHGKPCCWAKVERLIVADEGWPGRRLRPPAFSLVEPDPDIARYSPDWEAQP